MAVIEVKGQRLIANRNKSSARLYVKGRAENTSREFGGLIKFDRKLFSLYELEEDRPRSRGDLTNDAMTEALERLIDELADENDCEPEDVHLRRAKFEERDVASEAREAVEPDWENDWPDEGSKSDQVRFLLGTDYPTYDDDAIVAIVGCSRSLVTELRGEN